jgi:predicted transposase YdaD
MKRKKPRKNQKSHHPHDKYARSALQNRELAIDMIRLSVPEQLRDTIDLESLRPGRESFVDEKMTEHFLDVCYNGRMKNGENLRVSILFEHKSTTPEAPVYFQLLRYIVRINTHELDQGMKPSVVIPILLYQGPKPFKKELMEDIYKEYDNGLHKLIPGFDYFVTDVNDMTLWDRSQLISRLLYYFVKALFHGRNQVSILVFWDEFRKFVSESGFSSPAMFLIRITVAYYGSISEEFKIKHNKDMAYEFETPFEKMVEALYTEENMPYIRQRLADVEKLRAEREEGISEGMAKGKLEGKLEGKIEGKIEGKEIAIRTFLSRKPEISDAEAAFLFDVSSEYIRNLRGKTDKG